MMGTRWILLGVIFGSLMVIVLLGLSDDIALGQQGYDSFYHRYYTPYTSPMATEQGLAQIRNLPVGQRAWVRSGAGCEYLIEHAYDPAWKHHLGKVLEARSRWGLPCHQASWWRSGSIIADGGLDDCPNGRWQARRQPEGGGWVLRWKCQREDRR